MANVKISDLTAYTDPVATDVLPIVDLVNDQTKKVKVEDLLKKFGAGTEALPSFAFTGDLDTGIYSPGANQFAVSTGGTQRLLIDASGNTTIQGDLTVNGTTTTIESTTLSIDDKNIELGTVSTPSDTTADGGGITLKGATDKTINWVQSTGCWTFNQPTNFNNHVRIDSSGRVGIGTTSPQLKFVVSNSGANGFEVDPTQDSGATTGINSYNRSSSAFTKLRLNASSHQFDISSSTKMVVDSSGRLLVNGTSASGDNKLQVIDSDVSIYGVTVGRGKNGVSSNTAIGTSALFTNTTGSSNTGVGLNALYYVTTGSNNTGVGRSALQQTTGSNNTAVGSFALHTNNAGSDNTSVGYLSLYYNTTGNNNTAVGRYALVNNTTGSKNIGIGYTAGDAITTGSNNTIIGDIAGTTTLSDTVIIGAGSAERLRIDSSGRVGIGTTSPGQRLDVSGDARLIATNDTARQIIFDANRSGAAATIANVNFAWDGTNVAQIRGITGSDTTNKDDGHLEFFTAASGSALARMRIDSSGRLLVGTSTSTSSNGQSITQVASTSNDRAIAAYNFENDASGPYLTLGKSRGTSVGSFTILQNNDELGNIAFFAADGTDLNTEGARIQAEVDGTPGTNDMPTRLVFATTSDGANNPTERLRIDSSGKVGIGTTSPSGTLVVSNGGAAGLEFFPASFEIQAYNRSTSSYGLARYNAAGHQFAVNATERARIDSSGRLIIGASSARVVGTTRQFTIEGTDSPTSSASIFRNSNTAGGAVLALGKSRGTTDGSSTVLQSGDQAGAIFFYGADGTDAVSQVASISAEIDGAPGSNDMPGRLVFNTTADGSYIVTERMRIDSSGRLLLGTTSPGPAGGGQLTIADSTNAGITIRSGTSAAGSILFEDDTADRGELQYSHNGDYMRFKTAGSERLRIDSSGNVGIGESSPSSYDSGARNLVVGSNTHTGILIKAGTSSYSNLYFGDGTGSASYSGFIAYNHNENTLRVGANGSERMRITSSGNVGIGTNSPTEKLTVTGGNIQVDASSRKIGFKLSGNSNAGYLIPYTSGGNTELVNERSGSSLIFKTANTERMRVDGSGRLLLGLTSIVSPNINGIGYANRFQIQGAATGDGLMVANTADFARINMVRRADVATDTQLGTISFGQSSGINPLERARISCFSETTGGTGGLGGNLRFYTSADGSYQPAERMRLDNAGHLLAGGRTSSTGSGEDIQDSKGGIRAIPQTSKTAAYTLVVGDVGKHVNITTGGVTIPSGVFSVGDAVSIYNDSSSDQTITQGSSVTLRLAGDGGTGNKTLAGYGLCTVLCVTSNEFVIAGTGLS